MKPSSQAIIDEYIARYPSLLSCKASICSAANLLFTAFYSGKKLLICGNGGSASDSLHIVGELMKSFTLPRPISPTEATFLHEISSNGAFLAAHLQQALPAIALVEETSLHTAYANDVASQLCFAQQVYGYGNPGDVLLCISTSGNSENVVYAAETAKLKQMQTIALTGCCGGRLFQTVDICIKVPAKKTHEVQEFHLPVYHCLCLVLEHEFFA